MEGSTAARPLCAELVQANVGIADRPHLSNDWFSDRPFLKVHRLAANPIVLTQASQEGWRFLEASLIASIIRAPLVGASKASRHMPLTRELQAS